MTQVPSFPTPVDSSAPRPPMTFEQQAELLEYMHASMSRISDSRYVVTVTTYLDQAQVDDLVMTAMRLRRMAPYEEQIKDLVMGR